MFVVEVVREGFMVGEDLVKYMKVVSVNDDFLVSDLVWVQDFVLNGMLLGLGDRIMRKRLVSMFEKIVIEGFEVFYEGEIVDLIIKIIQENNGMMMYDDLREYIICMKQFFSIDYCGFKFYMMVVFSSGVVMFNIFKVMEQFFFEDLVDKSLIVYRFIEVMKFVYGVC